MTPATLHAFLRSLSQADTAWTTTSTSGAAHVQAVSNLLVTLSDATLHSGSSPPVVGQLSALHNAATESMKWLRKCLARLSAALRGAKQAQQTVATARGSGGEAADALAIPVSRWAELMGEVVEGLESDLKDKRGVVATLHETASTAHVVRERLQVAVATWLEQPSRNVGQAAILLAAFEAEDAQMVATGMWTGERMQSPARKVEEVGKAVSPALAMLKEAGQRKKR